MRVVASGCRILFSSSTYGEGDAPGSAARFASRLAALVNGKVPALYSRLRQ